MCSQQDTQWSCSSSATSHAGVAAQKGLAADNSQPDVPEFGSFLASGPCGMALTVSAVG